MPLTDDGSDQEEDDTLNESVLETAKERAKRKPEYIISKYNKQIIRIHPKKKKS